MVAWATALSKTRNIIKQVFSPSAGDIDELNVEDLEEVLLRSDVPARLTMEIVDKLDSAPRKTSRKDLLRDLLLDELGENKLFSWPTDKKPFVLLLLGVNGSGKTTTAAKLAKMTIGLGMKPMLCGSDTFRAAGSSQLKLWSERVGSEFVGGDGFFGALGQCLRPESCTLFQPFAVRDAAQLLDGVAIRPFPVLSDMIVTVLRTQYSNQH